MDKKLDECKKKFWCNVILASLCIGMLIFIQIPYINEHMSKSVYSVSDVMFTLMFFGNICCMIPKLYRIARLQRYIRIRSYVETELDTEVYKNYLRLRGETDDV